MNLFITLIIVCSSSMMGLTAEKNTIDICSLPFDSGICRANLQSWGYDTIQKKCVLFRYGGCGSNGNNFKTKSKCENACLRKLKTEEVNLIEKYDALSGQCNCKCPESQQIDQSLDGPIVMNFVEGKRAFPRWDADSNTLLYDE